MGRWEGGGVGGGGGWGAVGGLKQTFKHKWQCCAIKHSNTNGSAVPSVGDPAGHNSPGGPSLPSESVWHPKQSY